MPTTTFGPADLDRLRAEHPDLRILDVRTPGEFAEAHIAGSYNVPLPDLDEHRAELTADAAGPVVLVCRSGQRASTAEAQLADAGLDRIHVLAGGVLEWERTGRTLVRVEGDVPWALERQIRLVAGGIVAASIAASVAWVPARFVAGAIGLGLVLAAVTDTCLMGMVLARLPYNRRRANTCDMPAVVSHLTAGGEGAR